jgi:hypothetical protein
MTTGTKDRRTFLGHCIALAVAGGLAGTRESQAAAPAGAVEIRGARWWDGRRFVERTGYIVADRFADTRPAGAVRLLELDGAFLVPPLEPPAAAPGRRAPGHRHR